MGKNRLKHDFVPKKQESLLGGNENTSWGDLLTQDSPRRRENVGVEENVFISRTITNELLLRYPDNGHPIKEDIKRQMAYELANKLIDDNVVELNETYDYMSNSTIMTMKLKIVR